MRYAATSLNAGLMLNYPHLRNAPVAEAVIEIRARLVKPAGELEFVAFQERLKDRYPKAQQIRFFSTELKFEADAPTRREISNGIVGVRLDDADGKWVVQGKSDGLTISRLTPYDSWNDLVGNLQALWPVYVDIFKPEAAVRLGVRYINAIPLPLGKHDLDAILTAGPRIPQDFVPELSEFMTRLVLPMPDNETLVTIVQALGAVAVGGVKRDGVILDIDAACEQSFEPDWSPMWAKLEMLRDAKNKAFFSSLHKPTWEQFL